MKKLHYIALAISALVFTGCDDEDGFYNEKYIDTGELITVDTQPTFAVGDFLYVDADFSRYVPEQGQSSDLDVFQTTMALWAFSFLTFCNGDHRRASGRVYRFRRQVS